MYKCLDCQGETRIPSIVVHPETGIECYACPFCGSVNLKIEASGDETSP